MRTCNKKFLIIRNDDIQNLSKNEQEEFLPILQIYPQVFGVIPFASNNKVFTFDDQKLFTFLDPYAIEYALHGIFHDNYNSKHEFSLFNEEQYQKYRLYFDKLTMLTNNIKTFIPPHNDFDFSWIKILKNNNIEIISSTKRELPPKQKNNILFFPIGVIEFNDMYLIPQSFMVRKKHFLISENYFENLLKKINIFYETNNILVITIHWKEFTGKKLVDEIFRNKFKQLLLELKKKNINATSFTKAKNLKEKKYIEADFFDNQVRNIK